MPDPVVALVPAPDELVVEYLAAEPGRLTVVAAARRPVAACPACGCVSGRVQSRYERRLADLPWHGLAVALRVRVRRFVCDLPRCPRRIFCERLPGTACAYARRTTRHASALELIGLALGGEAGARLARELGMAAGASADTLLRVLKATPVRPAGPPVRVLGVDDWAWRGRGSGTAPCSSIWSAAACSTCCRTASQARSRRGCGRTPVWRSSRATGRAPTPRARR